MQWHIIKINFDNRVNSLTVGVETVSCKFLFDLELEI